MIEASLRGADLDSIGAVSCDTVAFEGWHLTQRFDRQAEVNKKVRARYRKLCGRDLQVAEMDMSSPELIAAAEDLGIILGPDGRVLRTDNDPDLRGGRKSGTLSLTGVLHRFRPLRGWSDVRAETSGEVPG